MPIESSSSGQIAYKYANCPNCSSGNTYLEGRASCYCPRCGQKLKVLTKIANRINAYNITWAVGGSTLLFLKGVADHFNDIDIIVDEHDVEHLKKLLLEIGRLEPENPHKDFKTKRFLEFVIDDVDIDVMADFIIVNDNKEYCFPLEKNNVLEFIDIEGTKIPLQSIEEWKHYYELMKRIDKVDLINIKKF